MNFAAVENIANAVLYEGYILYPYRASSTKNRQRWNFGTLFPQAFAEAHRPAERSQLVAECPIEADSAARLDIRIRFLQLVEPENQAGGGEQSAEGWQHGIERAHDIGGLNLSSLATPHIVDFSIPSGEIEARARELNGRLRLNATAIPGGYKLHVELTNTTLSAGNDTRHSALPRSFTSAHILLGLQNGNFVSLLDPPEGFRPAVSSCKNDGVFPVLVGTEGQRSMMLCSPIILYDYPRIAPESAGDFFDGTEMDEMLALRVLTLTDAEKREMLNDERARQILERTESLPQEHLLKVHGAIRGMRRIGEDAP